MLCACKLTRLITGGQSSFHLSWQLSAQYRFSTIIMYNKTIRLTENECQIGRDKVVPLCVWLNNFEAIKIYEICHPNHVVLFVRLLFPLVFFPRYFIELHQCYMS
jgi:hypothetical protein